MERVCERDVCVCVCVCILYIREGRSCHGIANDASVGISQSTIPSSFHSFGFFLLLFRVYYIGGGHFLPRATE